MTTESYNTVASPNSGLTLKAVQDLKALRLIQETGKNCLYHSERQKMLSLESYSDYDRNPEELHRPCMCTLQVGCLRIATNFF